MGRGRHAIASIETVKSGLFQVFQEVVSVPSVVVDERAKV